MFILYFRKSKPKTSNQYTRRSKRVNGNPRPAFTLQVQNKDMHVSKAFCLLQTYFINLVGMHHCTVRLQIFVKRVNERSNAPGLWIPF